MELFHRFNNDDREIEPPLRFNNPFHYRPHRLCLQAADEVKVLLSSDAGLAAEAAKGKMFGVLVVRDACGSLGYLAAFSGLLGGRNVQPGFVPAVFDFHSPDSYFKREEARISLINHRIADICSSEEYKKACDDVNLCRNEAAAKLDTMREENRIAKQARDNRRAAGGLTPEVEAELLCDSRYRKAELRRHTRMWNERIAETEAIRASYDNTIAALKEERSRRSGALQEWLFSQFVMLNARGESRTLLQIFADERGTIPPAGAGECAAPKLLQYAYMNGLHPLCMAEFWVGASPAGELRRDGCFYGSCKGKCEPILAFMLRGLDVEKSSLEDSGAQFSDIPIVYEDDWLVVVDKPSGMLSVPGKVGGRSVQDWLVCHFGSDDIYVTHRLDMSTSGLLVAAKGVEAFKAMQSLFARRMIDKCYTALLDGVPRSSEGEISLPLSSDYMNRPRQMVDFLMGKEAVTRYSILSKSVYRGRECAVAALYPLTGRTHQLRVHCAHSQGLDCPIVGDELYGSPGDRLMLHASRIAFEHPFTHRRVVLESKAMLL